MIYMTVHFLNFLVCIGITSFERFKIHYKLMIFYYNFLWLFSRMLNVALVQAC